MRNVRRVSLGALAARMSSVESAWLPGLCLSPLGRGRHSRGKAACLAHPPHTHPPKTNALAVEDVIDVVAVYGVDDERFLDRSRAVAAK